MYTYKFRLFFDEVEDFVRDYEIFAKQTFKDLHDVIIKSIAGLDGQELASFYICDGRWERQREITLIDMNMDENSDVLLENKGNGETYISKTIMSDGVLSDFIEDPHQRLIYEYNFLNINTFYLELLKTFESEKTVKYPRCTHSVGEMPTASSNILDDDLDVDLNLEENVDNIDYYDEEDFQSLNDDIEI